MLDLKNDPRCQAIENKLDEYARGTKEWVVSRSNYVRAQLGNKYQFKDNVPYPYDDDRERLMMNDINRYLLSFEDDDRKQVNGHLLWKYKDYFGQPFAKHAVRLVSMSVAEHPLSDSNKIKFLEYIFACGKYKEFDPVVLYKLAVFNPKDNPHACNRLYIKTMRYFRQKKRKNDAFARLALGMFKSFAGNLSEILAEDAVNFSRIYFEIIERLPDAQLQQQPERQIHIPLLNMVTKTPQALADKEQWDEEFADTKVLRDIFAAYKTHVMEEDKFNPYLGVRMMLLAQKVLQNYPCGKNDVDDWIAAVRPPDIGGGNGRKIRKNQKLIGLQKVADGIEACFNEVRERQILQYLGREDPLKNVDIWASGFEPDEKMVLDYASYLFDYAAFFRDETVKTDKLMVLLQKNAAARRLDTIPATLFSKEKKIKAVDKNLVLDIARKYAVSINDSNDDFSNLNYSLGGGMCELFTELAVNYNYAPKDTKALADVLIRESKGSEFLQEMGLRISMVCAAKQNRFVIDKGRSL